jgi:hypothetical protein
LVYGLIRCAEVKYLTPDNIDYLSLELYDMGNPVNAFGIFSNECYPPVKQIKIGARGYQQEQYLIFQQGNYYVKISYNQDKLAPLAYELGIKTCASLKEDATGLEVLQYFPKESQIPLSEKFVARNYLGLEFLNQVWSATYAVKDHTLTLFFKQLDNSVQARQLFAKISGRLENLGRKVKKLKNPGDEAIISQSEFHKKS